VRFLVDQPISWEVAEGLRELGHDAIHVRAIGLDCGEDLPILERAAAEDRVVVTQDTDYGTLLMTGHRLRPSVILFRMRDGRPTTQLAVLRQCLSRLENELIEGAIAVIGDASVRVRRLR
jgi:predicted nuclease of predicted toxin-antitoxin system